MKFFVRSQLWSRIVGAALSAAIIVTAAAYWGPGVHADDAAAGTLTFDSIRTMLTNLGYEFKEEKYNESKTSQGSLFTLKIERDGWALSHYISFSSSHEWIWVTSNGQIVPKDKRATVARVLALLQANNGPTAHFSVDPQSGLIVINRPVENRGITPAVLRKVIEDIDSFKRHTDALWAAEEMWKDEASPTPPPSGGNTNDAAPRHSALGMPDKGRAKRR